MSYDILRRAKKTENNSSSHVCTGPRLQQTHTHKFWTPAVVVLLLGARNTYQVSYIIPSIPAIVSLVLLCKTPACCACMSSSCVSQKKMRDIYVVSHLFVSLDRLMFMMKYSVDRREEEWGAYAYGRLYGRRYACLPSHSNFTRDNLLLCGADVMKHLKRVVLACSRTSIIHKSVNGAASPTLTHSSRRVTSLICESKRAEKLRDLEIFNSSKQQNSRYRSQSWISIL